MLEEVVIAGGEDIAGIALGRALGEAWSDLLHECLQVEIALHGRSSRFDPPRQARPGAPGKQLQYVKWRAPPCP
ncbi:hypothetical protein [Siccirubricoccus sp. G192]|uniref:hypothetical protein n=1 Tax=Siccirubricoccus sp. G192 TaxID=2849651 RepID=UPI001C2BE755|nr:hypothetical protein [Siccirubricoccus sp. G192]MBV1797173.1 hypothetical protein [Siccirubricoccus sp. G192]